MYINAKNLVLKDSGATQNTVSGTSAKETQTGTARNDVFYATSGDTMIGGAGDDTYYIWDVNHTIIENANEGIDTLIANVWGAVTLSANVENLILRGDGARSGTGNALDNILVASNAGSTLNGMAGDDVLVGGARGDLFRIVAGNGSDVIVNFTSGSDSIQLQGYNVSSFNQLMSLAVQDGKDVRFNMSNGEILVLRDISLTNLHSYDFGFRIPNIADAGETTLVGAGKAITNNGWYTLNNVWNPGTMVENKDFFIESTTNRANMSHGTTFTWSFPFTTEYGAPVRAYPEIIFGPAPMGGGQKASDVGGVFPLQVSSIASLAINYDVSISGNTSGFNVAFDIWLTKTPGGSGAAAVSNEIMIWTHSGDFPAFGPQVGTYAQGDVTFKIYHTGTYTALVADSDQFKGSIDFVAMLAKLVELGIVSRNEYLASIELGSEVFSGTGSLTINNLDIAATTVPVNGVSTNYVVNGAGTTRTEVTQTVQRPVETIVDTVVGGKTVHNEDGTHVVTYAKATAGVTADLLSPSTNTGLATGDVFKNITGLTGSAFDDILRGDAGANTLSGGAGNDLLVGRGGDDILEGGDGDDVLQGDAGADILRGGAGSDTASYQGSTAGVVVDLANPSANTGEAAGDTYDSIENISGSAFNDTLSGDAGANVIFGNAGNDTIRGRDGDDTLDGGTGNDNLYGDAGNDVLIGGDGDDLLVGGTGADRLDGGAGTDTAGYQASYTGVRADLEDSSRNTGEAAGDTYVSIENLIGSSLNDILVGNAGANLLFGGAGDDLLLGRDGNDILDAGDGNDTLDGGTGNDTLRGGAGNDVLIGGLGADILDGGAGIDLVSYEGATTGVVVDFQAPASNTGEAAGDTFFDVEDLSGSAFNDTLNGNAANNTIYGNAGNDTISGRNGDDILWGGTGDDVLYGDAGADRLYGGDGNDRLIGGVGADYLDGGAGVDEARYHTASAGVTVDMEVQSNNTGDAAGDILVNVENLLGSNFNDILRGDGGSNVLSGGSGDDVLQGRGGDDFLEGGIGADLLDGGDGYDVAQYATATAGVTVDLAKPNLNTGIAAGDKFVSIEGVIGSMFDDILRGDAGANYLMGGLGNDILSGGEGNDTLRGGLGNDVLTGGAGADRFLFGVGDGFDKITDFVCGVDRITLQRSAFGLTGISGAERALTTKDADFVTNGTTATSGRPTFFWNSQTGQLSYDADGTGAGKPVVLATLTPGLKLSLNDIHTISDADMDIGNLLDSVAGETSPLSLTLTAETFPVTPVEHTTKPVADHLDPVAPTMPMEDGGVHFPGDAGDDGPVLTVTDIDIAGLHGLDGYATLSDFGQTMKVIDPIPWLAQPQPAHWVHG
jgi:serralysin